MTDLGLTSSLSPFFVIRHALALKILSILIFTFKIAADRKISLHVISLRVMLFAPGLDVILVGVLFLAAAFQEKSLPLRPISRHLDRVRSTFSLFRVILHRVLVLMLRFHLIFIISYPQKEKICSFRSFSFLSTSNKCSFD